MKTFWLIILLWILPPACAFADGLRAGVARVEITPPTGYPMGGYAARQGPSTGVHDPLYATALTLEADGVRVAIISCDLRSFPSARVVAAARDRKLADHVLIAVTHTHSGPITWEDQSWPRRERSWFAETEEKLLAAIGQAAKSAFPARLAAGFGEIYLGHNRREVGVDGKTTMRWRNAEKKPTAPIDPGLGVIRVDDETGVPRAVIVNYACHAVVLGPDNRRISADYPGFLARRIERELTGALCLFVQGGAGDINPYLDKQPVDQNGFREAEKMGNLLADEALKIIRRLKPAAEPEASIRTAAEIVEFQDRWDGSKTLRAGLTTLLINRNIAIATIPGEPFVDLQIAFRDRSEIVNSFLFGYTYSAGGDWVGYIPTLRAAAEGGYGAGYNTRIEAGAGEAMIDRAVISLYRLLGKLKETPSR